MDAWPREAEGTWPREAAGTWPREAAGTWPGKRVLPTAEARLPRSPYVAGGGTTENTQGQEVGEGVRKDTPLPANEGRSAGPRFPRGVLAL